HVVAVRLPTTDFEIIRGQRHQTHRRGARLAAQRACIHPRHLYPHRRHTLVGLILRQRNDRRLHPLVSLFVLVFVSQQRPRGATASAHVLDMVDPIPVRPRTRISADTIRLIPLLTQARTVIETHAQALFHLALERMIAHAVIDRHIKTVLDLASGTGCPLSTDRCACWLSVRVHAPRVAGEPEQTKGTARSSGCRPGRERRGGEDTTSPFPTRVSPRQTYCEVTGFIFGLPSTVCGSSRY